MRTFEMKKKKKKRKKGRKKQKATPWNKTRNLRNQNGFGGKSTKDKTSPEEMSSFWSLRCELPAECKQLALVGLFDAGKL